MAQVVKMALDSAFEREQTIPLDETLTEIQRALPRNHWITGKLSELFETVGVLLEDLSNSVQQFETDPDPDPRDALEAIIETYFDWERGLVDWKDIESLTRVIRQDILK